MFERIDSEGLKCIDLLRYAHTGQFSADSSASNLIYRLADLKQPPDYSEAE